MDMVTSKTSNVGTQAVPNQVDVLELEERVLLQGKKKGNLSPCLSGHLAPFLSAEL